MSQNNQLLIKLNNLYSTFTKTEKLLADFIVKNDKQVIYMSIAELSYNANVGEATIIRFCHKLDFDGYYAFKMAMALDTTENDDQTNKPIEEILPEDSTNTVIDKLTAYVINSLGGTKILLDEKLIQQAVDIILNAKKIKVYGIGSSSIAAMDAKYRFTRLGFNIDCFTDGHMMAIDASLSTSQDVIIGISYSGDTKDIIDAFKIAHENQAYTIVITHFKKSNLAKYAKNTLLIGSKEGPLQGGRFETKVTQMFIIEILVSEILKINKGRLEIKNKTSKAISQKMM